MPAATVEEAFAYCEARTKAHYENFPVGLFVPARASARTSTRSTPSPAPPTTSPTSRSTRACAQEKLDQWEALLHAAYRGEAEGPIFVALAETVRRLDIPKQLLLDLLSAFRQDTVKNRYATWDELLDYCRRSANPVGRLVLLVFERDATRRCRRSPTRSAPACSSPTTGRTRRSTYARGRIYVPEELLRRHGVSELGLLNAGRVSDGWRGLMAELIARTRALFEEGRPLCDRVGPRAALRDAAHLARRARRSSTASRPSGGDVFRRRPHHGPLDKAALAWRAWRWRAA